MMRSETIDKLINEIIIACVQLPPWQRIAVLIFVLLVLIIVSLVGKLMWPYIFGIFGHRSKKESSSFDYAYDFVLLFGAIARDLTYGIHRRRKENETQTFALARRAILAGITKTLNKKNADFARACILVPKGEYLIIDEAGGYSAEACENMRLEIKKTIAGEAFDSAKIRYCEDRLKDPSYKEHPKRKRNYRSIVCIPIADGNRVYGVLNIDALPVKAFSENMLKSLGAFAYLLAMTYVLEGGDIGVAKRNA